MALLFCAITAKTYADNPIYSWHVSDLARAQEKEIKLTDKQGQFLYIINVQQMVYLYAAMISIAEAGEIQADFIIIPGTLPNAFAGITEKDQDFVAINFAMLDILGTDMDMAAALLGHELAHLKLNHGRSNKKQVIINQGGSFSASDTRYSRDNEREADYLGTIWAVEAGYDPEGAVALQTVLYKYFKKVASSSFSASHPSGIERITVLKSLARRLSNR